jgi:hypothetical protein
MAHAALEHALFPQAVDASSRRSQRQYNCTLLSSSVADLMGPVGAGTAAPSENGASWSSSANRTSRCESFDFWASGVTRDRRRLSFDQTFVVESEGQR